MHYFFWIIRPGNKSVCIPWPAGCRSVKLNQCCGFTFDADPDTFFYCDTDPDPGPSFHLNADPDPDPTTHLFPNLYDPMLQNDPVKLPPFHLDADPGPAFHFDPDPDQAFYFDGIRMRIHLPKMMRIHVDRNLQ
jgi:hypothetical protein